MIEINMPWHEIEYAAVVGIKRHLQNLQKGNRPAYGNNPRGPVFDSNIIGCIGEQAVAKYFNRYWSGSLGNWNAADVGTRLEVRSTTHEDGSLILHDRDKMDSIYILVTVSLPRLNLIGWMYARDGVNEKYYSAGTHNRPAYFIPQADLRPIEEIVPELKKRLAAN